LCSIMVSAQDRGDALLSSMTVLIRRLWLSLRRVLCEPPYSIILVSQLRQKSQTTNRHSSLVLNRKVVLYSSVQVNGILCLLEYELVWLEYGIICTSVTEASESNALVTLSHNERTNDCSRRDGRMST
jgi:hypothetical protein